MADALIILIIWATCILGLAALPKKAKRNVPVATLGIAMVTLLLNCIGNAIPAFLQFMMRDRTDLLHGELWRLVTPLFAQDGHWAGTFFNVGCLLAIGTVAEWLLGRRRWLIAYFGTGLLAEVVAYTLMQHQGFAGNSIANLGLAAAAVVYVATTTKQFRLRLGSWCVIAVGLVLLTLGNLHGAAFVIGSVIALALLVVKLPKSSSSFSR